MRRQFAFMIAAAVTTGGFALTPAASSAPIEAGTLEDPGQASSAAPIEPELIDEGRSRGKKSKKIQRTEVCFTVHVIGDPQAHQVSGTLFHSRKRYTGGGTALLLQHGSVSERSVWDGASPNATGGPTIPEQLAAAGYAVFAIDRLGYGRSPYPGSGWALTMDSQVEMTHEMVTQIRSGTYRVTNNDQCHGGAEAERPAEKVVLMGHSGGAGLTEYYATQYHDIDGIVPMAWSNHWLVEGENKWSDYFISEVLLGQLAQGNDYVYIFWGEDGYSQSCEDFLFYLEGSSDDSVQQICGPGYFGGDEPRLMPSGDLASQVIYIWERIKLAIRNVGPTPALLVFADKDHIFPGPEFGGGAPDTITPEIQMWKERCNCDVEVLWQKNAGHANLWHDTGPMVINDVITWLRSQDL